MAYLIDRTRAIRTTELIAIVRGHQRRVRSQMIFRNNSIYNSLTRPLSVVRVIAEATASAKKSVMTTEQLRRTTTLVWPTQR